MILFRHGTSVIFGLWAFRKYIFLYVSNVHKKSMLHWNKIDAFFFNILVWNIFSDLYVTCNLLHRWFALDNFDLSLVNHYEKYVVRRIKYAVNA